MGNVCGGPPKDGMQDGMIRVEKLVSILNVFIRIDSWKACSNKWNGSQCKVSSEMGHQ